MFAVFVTFHVKPGHEKAFLERMRRQAADSLAFEEACRTFEVWVKDDNANTVQLYELYDDAGAFDAHLQSSHFIAFAAEVEAMIEDRVLLTFDRKV